MKKLVTLFSLLVLAMFSYAQETVYTYDFEDGINPFTDDSRITSGIEYDITADGNVLGWTCANNAQNGYSFSHFDFTSLLDKPETVKIEFDYYNTAGGRSVLVIGDASVRGTTGGSSIIKYNLTGAIFYIGSNKDKSFIGEEYFPLKSQVGELGVEEGLCNRWLHIAVTVNTEGRTVAWTVADVSGPELSSGSAAYYSDDAIDCTQIDVFGFINNSHCCMMDNLTITNYKSNAQYADYTVRYVDEGGNELKPSRSGNGKVGGHATLLPSDKEPFYSEDGTMKYFYVSDNSDSEVIAEQGTLISVLFREAETWYAVLDCVTDEDVSLAQLTGTFLEGDELTLYPSRGHEYAGAYYMTPATFYNGAPFTFPGFLQPVQEGGKTCFKGKQVYTKDANVAYYSEFERLALPQTDEGYGTGLGQLFGTVNSWYSFSGSYFDRFSGGRGIRLNAESYVWTEPVSEAGTYRVTIYGRNDVSADATEPYRLGLRDAEGNVTYFVGLTIPSWKSATTGSSIVEDVVIPQGYSLVVMNPSKSNIISLDDITLTAIVPSVCYTEFDDGTGTLTYYYDGLKDSRTGVTEVYDPANHPLRFNDYYNKIVKVVIDTSMSGASLTSMKNMFYGGLCTSPVRFQSLSALTSIEGLENLNTETVTDMSGMFTMCQSLTELDLSTFNTSNVTTMNAMFSNCANLQQVDVTSFDVTGVTDFGYMFNACSKLQTIYCSGDWSTGSAKSSSMFTDCTALVGGKGTTFDAAHRDKSYARPDGGTESPGYFTVSAEKGDVNNDGVVDIADVVAVLNTMASDADSPSADVNADNVVDIADVVAVLNIMAGQ